MSFKLTHAQPSEVCWSSCVLPACASYMHSQHMNCRILSIVSENFIFNIHSIPHCDQDTRYLSCNFHCKDYTCAQYRPTSTPYPQRMYCTPNRLASQASVRVCQRWYASTTKATFLKPLIYLGRAYKNEACHRWHSGQQICVFKHCKRTSNMHWALLKPDQTALARQRTAGLNNKGSNLTLGDSLCDSLCDILPPSIGGLQCARRLWV